MSKKIVPINYTSRDYDTIRRDLLNYAKRYYPDIIQDFNEGSFNSFVFDTVAYVGDILSFYVDFQANESFLSTAVQYSNIVKLGEELGYKFSSTVAASQGIVALYTLIPANSDGSPDLTYNPILKKGSTFNSSDGKVFTLVDDVKMYEADKSTIRASRKDDNGTNIEFAVKNYGKVISGRVVQEKFTIGEFSKFKKITLGETDVTEIISVFDDEGHEYFEVDYLTQNTIYREMKNTSVDSEIVPSVLRNYSVPRRFITQRNQSITTLTFGASSALTTQDFKDILSEPTTFMLDIESKRYFTDKSFDPNTMVTSDKLGVGPSNTILTVTYRINNSDTVNVSTGFLNKVTFPIVEFQNSDQLIESKKNEIIASFEIENEEPILGSVSLPNSQELKLRIRDNFAAQNRAVTIKDYESLCYSMPLKFGAVKRVRALKDQDSFKRNINLYILSEDATGNFAKASQTLKNNLKMWLNNNKMLSDTIDILDAKIINLKINFKVVGNDRFSKSDVLEAGKQALTDYFARRPEIGEPLLIGDLNYALRNKTEIVDVVNIEILQQNGVGYSDVYYNIKDNISADQRYLNMPKNAVYELKIPLDNITGVVI
jgi:hypothetical protein